VGVPLKALFCTARVFKSVRALSSGQIVPWKWSLLMTSACGSRHAHNSLSHGKSCLSTDSTVAHLWRGFGEHALVCPRQPSPAHSAPPRLCPLMGMRMCSADQILLAEQRQPAEMDGSFAVGS
jgi:hypothetical protein